MSWLLSDRNRPYVPAANTDILRTWQKHGFVPPSSLKPTDLDRAKNDLMLMLQMKGTHQ